MEEDITISIYLEGINGPSLLGPFISTRRKSEFSRLLLSQMEFVLITTQARIFVYSHVKSDYYYFFGSQFEVIWAC